MKKKYEVFFHQINQQKYEVEASSVDEAIAKAAKLWKAENGPNVSAVQGVK